jgi:hypothetical protein
MRKNTPNMLINHIPHWVVAEEAFEHTQTKSKNFAGEKKKDLCVRKVAVLFRGRCSGIELPLQRRKRAVGKKKKVLASPATLMRAARTGRRRFLSLCERRGCYYCARRGGDDGDSRDCCDCCCARRDGGDGKKKT